MSSIEKSGWKVLRKHKEQDYGIAHSYELILERLRDGSQHPRVVFETPDWCNIIPVRRDGRIVMVRQLRFGIWRPSLEIPGGIVDPGEDPRAAAIRELAEETGYRPREVISLGSVHPNPALQPNRIHSFLALDCEEGDARPEHGEDIEVTTIGREEIPRLISDGSISHALVVSAFYLEAIRAK
ncbi:MAG: NUDIX hydrolase [Myxococcaceae bacterium]